MSIKRQAAAERIATPFLSSKTASADLTAARLRLAADMVEQRHALRIPAADADASEAVRLMIEAASFSAAAHQAQVTAHAHLATLAGRLNLDPVGFGDTDESYEYFARGRSENVVPMKAAG